MQQRTRIWSRILPLALISALLALPLLGQGVQTGTLTGTVTDSSDSKLPGVLVTATSPALQGERTAVSGANGDYVIRGLPPGQYTVRFTLEGLSTQERTASVDIGTPARVDSEMALATVTETVIVTGESANALETVTVGANYEAEMIDQLANARDLDGIALLAPGATANTPQVGQVSISGGFGYDSAFLLDGVDINDNVFGNPDNLFIEDAIEEVQILTSGISAEFGRFSGGVVNGVTKTGGNEYRGSFRIDIENPSWQDETPFEQTNGIERLDTRDEIYSATLGGFAIKDRLWFFVAGRDEFTTQQDILEQTGIPFNADVDDERYEVKLTGSITNSHRLSATVTDNQSSNIQPASTSEGATPDTLIQPNFPNDLFITRYDGVFGSNIFVEGQYSEKNFGFRNFGGTSTDIFDSPFRCWNIDPCQYNAPLFDANDPSDRNNEQLAGAASFFLSSASRGSHDLKIGVENFKNITTGGNANSATDWVFFHDFKLDAGGRPILTEGQKAIPVFIGFPNPNFGLGVFFEAFRGSEVSITTTSLYVNDAWQLNDHWSFNLGVRYEQNDSATTTGREPIDTDNIVPRLAATYDLKGDGKYRFDASYAEYVGAYNMALFTSTTNTGNASYVYGPYIGPTGEGTDFAPGFDPNNYFLVAGAIPTLNIVFDENLSAPINEEYSLSFGYQLPRAGYFKGTYVNRELTGIVDNFIRFENGISSGEIQGVPISLDTQVFENTDEATRSYEALILQGRYRVLDHLTVQGNFAWQLENDGNYEGESGNGIGPGVGGIGDYPELIDERSFPNGHLNEFQEHVLRVWGIYDLDLGRAGNMALCSTSTTRPSPTVWPIWCRSPQPSWRVTRATSVPRPRRPSSSTAGAARSSKPGIASTSRCATTYRCGSASTSGSRVSSATCSTTRPRSTATQPSTPTSTAPWTRWAGRSPLPARPGSETQSTTRPSTSRASTCSRPGSASSSLCTRPAVSRRSLRGEVASPPPLFFFPWRQSERRNRNQSLRGSVSRPFKESLRTRRVSDRLNGWIQGTDRLGRDQRLIASRSAALWYLNRLRNGAIPAVY
jgi:hypothetical protein